MEIKNTQSINIDLKKASVIPLPQFIQNDTNIINFKIKNNGEPADLGQIGRIVLNYKRPDRKVVSRLLAIEENSLVTYQIGLEEMERPGMGEIELQFYNTDNTQRISTKRFKIHLLAQIGTDHILDDSENLTALQELLVEVQDVNEKGDYAKAQGDYAKEQAETAKTNWLSPVATFADIESSYPTPSLGDTVQVLSNGYVYRYNGVEWIYTQGYSATALADVNAQLAQTEMETITLTHGTQVVNGEVGSPMKVEFYGNTLVNILGKGYNAEKSFLGADGTFSLVNEYPLLNNDGGYYLFALEVKSTDSKKVGIRRLDGSGATIEQKSVEVGNTYKTIYIKFSDVNVKKLVFVEGYVVGDIYYKNERLIKIDKSTYDKIGVSLTDADVERMFPYVDSVQHVKNPVVKVSGKNIFNGQLELGLILGANGQPSASTNNIRSVDFTPVLPNARYRLTDYQNGILNEGNTGISDVTYYDRDKNFISTTQKTGFNGATTPSNAHYIKFRSATGYINLDTKVQLELGDKVTPYTDYNPSYLYAETTLAGNSSKKDILSYNESKNRWEKIKWWETVELDGSLSWNPSTYYDGFKRVTVKGLLKPINDLAKYQYMVKFNGDIIRHSLAVDEVDTFVINVSGNVFLSVSNADSGWTEEMEPSQDLIKSYFYGWKMNSTDPENYGWESLVDGSTPPENTLEYVSTHMAEGFTPYKLTYQLAEPVIEEVQVEGDLIVSGQTQVEVGSEFTYEEDDNGKRTYTVTPDEERTGANLVEVKATYANNIRSSLDDVVEKQSDIATEVSIHARSLVELYARIKALEV